MAAGTDADVRPVSDWLIASILSWLLTINSLLFAVHVLTHNCAHVLPCCAVLQMCDLFLNASIFGWLPTIGSLLFPVHVRATGYNFAHTAAQSWLGGLTPLIISGINLRLQRSTAMTGAIYLVTGVYLTVCAAVSLVALWTMWRMFPQTNRDPPSAAKGTSHLPVSATGSTVGSGSGGGSSGNSGGGVAAGTASTA